MEKVLGYVREWVRGDISYHASYMVEQKMRGKYCRFRGRLENNRPLPDQPDNESTAAGSPYYHVGNDCLIRNHKINDLVGANLSENLKYLTF